MKLARVRTPAFSNVVAVIEETVARVLPLSSQSGFSTLADILHAPSPKDVVAGLLPQAKELPLAQVTFLSPVDHQEVWAAGVTYKRSQIARMEESESAASHYDKVYNADRPELFFKATPNRVVAHGQPVRVRFDSQWSVPEPEFTLVLNPRLEIVGYTIGNDMSARDIEGENPLYLPQAKVYRQCCALGPCVRLADGPLSLEETKISMTIHRGARQMYQGATSLTQLHRKLPDLAKWLGREDDFPTGAFLLTGTGLVPENDFTLEHGDQIAIEISGIGTLQNSVVKEPLRAQ
ncbi:fumarylacetoacetate hydrolase family protein [Planctomicrobium piriforme]|uniref:2-dehydro-3-deoxy-D-arabinonate dehydratase n=1 Tax=Planctomicrobium piriforme TaxID=1576369 RepID=A0A1I3HRD7_9PLAN|nr:fumarylacetoacetate hydrolase family protein [Planctomicrobium piriforme]SFI38241.1 2-dehydro-3-deoxy-D-arabinonate dehydratase [Planctomicrobium piriforme]